MKEAIQCQYDISKETYQQRFCGKRRKAKEVYVELASRLRDMAGKLMAVVHTVEEVLEKLVVEQLANTMPAEIRICVAERKPKTGLETGRLTISRYAATFARGPGTCRRIGARATPVILV